MGIFGSSSSLAPRTISLQTLMSPLGSCSWTPLMLQLLRPRHSNNWLIAAHKVLFLVIYSMELMKCGNEACHSCFRYNYVICIDPTLEATLILIIYWCNFYFLSLTKPFLAKYISSCICVIRVNGKSLYLDFTCRLPGKAYDRKQHVWLTGANDIDSKTFSRAILAKVLFASICLHFDDMRSLMALLNGSIIKWSLNELASQEGRQSFDHDVYETWSL